jgi:hypothetical protein
MTIKSQRDVVGGLLLAIVGIAFAIGATNYSFGVAAKPGPGYFPFGLGIILALLGGIVLVGGLTGRARPGNDAIGGIPWRPLVCVVGAIVFFGFFLPRFGFLITFPVMIVITAAGSREFAWKDALLNAVVLTAISYAVFIWGLALNIPLYPV